MKKIELIRQIAGLIYGYNDNLNDEEFYQIIDKVLTEYKELKNW